jgi:hypothetical protein
VPIISEIPGFVAFYWVDVGDGVVASTSVYEHKHAEEQSTIEAGMGDQTAAAMEAALS